MRFQLPLAVLLAVPTAAACGSVESPPATIDDVTSDLEKDTGGFDTADEAPAFADDTLFAAAELEADATFTDPMATDPGLVDLERDTPTSVLGRHVVILWGRMPADRDATTPRVWNGDLRLSRGGMLIKRRIAFEDATDRVLPRTTRDAISFESRTRPHADGLALAVYDPTPTAADSLTLTYTPSDGSPAYTIDLAQLDRGPIVIDAGDGNKLVVASRRRADRCDHGFLRGRWHALAPHAGHYVGLVLNGDGEPVGHIRGIYGERRTGESVFFGKFINREGGFRGLLQGSYDAGKFAARWIDRGGDHGVVGGVYVPGATLDAGQFLGRWAETSCAGN